MSADTVLIWLTLLGSLIACGSALRAVRSGIPLLRPLAAATAALAGIYAVAYLALLALWGESNLRWSQVMRGVSVVAWLVVWAGWPWMSVKAWRAAHRRLEEIGGPTDDRSG